MKQILTSLILATLVTLNSFAGTTYSITSNASYSAACTNCTFNISSGVTLTLNASGTCANCTFTGGSIVIAATITCQPCSFTNNVVTMNNQALNPNSGTTSFSGVTLTASGTSSILANTPVTISNSTFTFNNTSYFNNNGGQLDITNSTMKFYDDSYFIANAGPVNLRNSSYLIAGNGTTASHAYIKMNGPALNIYDANSGIILGNTNNYYFNWSSYNSISNSTSYTTTYPTAASQLNCGGAGQNACGMWSAPTVYGPALFSSTGVAGGASPLPVILTDFAANLNSNNTVALSWNTQQEMNSAYFEVQRSTDGINWENIGSVAAQGNSSVITSYSFTDIAALNGVAYYRLKMVDLDTKYKYSEVKVVRSTIVKSISFFPNPARDYVNVSLTESASDVTVQLISQSGQVLQERKVAAGNASTVTMQINQYAQGMYILRVAGEGTQQSSKLVIAH